ncbi:MAM and LDL-receptor class A domain-containing protein 1 [Nymphon striatum]|nr:MAM and LDL-receptor class A domain-containing protein 1 [Nymphon striatum]
MKSQNENQVDNLPKLCKINWLPNSTQKCLIKFNCEIPTRLWVRTKCKGIWRRQPTPLKPTPLKPTPPKPTVVTIGSAPETASPGNTNSKSASVPATVVAPNPIINTISAPNAEASSPQSTNADGLCDFGESGKALNWCTWLNNEESDFSWKLGSGKTHLIMGGPSRDATTGTEKGGYAYLELNEQSYRISGEAKLSSSIMESTIVKPEGSDKCLSFSHLLSNSGSLEVIMTDIKTNVNRTLWTQLTPNKDGMWSHASFLYAHDDQHQVTAHSPKIFVNGQTQRMMTSIGNLKGQVNILIMGQFLTTVCFMLHYATFYAHIENVFLLLDKFLSITGGYAFISSEYPRQPNEVARLVSQEFDASESPICMKFYVNLFGANDGQLRVLMQTNDSIKAKWIIPSGDDKQRWIKAQVLLSSSENFKRTNEWIKSEVRRVCGFEPETMVAIVKRKKIARDSSSLKTTPPPSHYNLFPSVIFEGQVSSRGRGKIAIDDISLHKESKSPSIGGIPEYDFNNHNVSGYYMGISGGEYSTSSLISPEIEPSAKPCISFMYIMWKRFAEMLGPSLGTLKVFLLTGTEANRTRTLLWKLSGHQIEKWSEARAPIRTRNGNPPAELYRVGNQISQSISVNAYLRVHALSGNAYNKAMRSHKLKFQALWRLLLQKFTQFSEQHDPALRDKIEEFSSDADKNKIEKLVTELAHSTFHDTLHIIEIEEESNFPIPNGLQTESAVLAVDLLFIYDGNCERRTDVDKIHGVAVGTQFFRNYFHFIYINRKWDTTINKAESIAGDCEFETDLCEWSIEDDQSFNRNEGEFNQYLNKWTLPRSAHQNDIEDHTYKRFTELDAPSASVEEYLVAAGPRPLPSGLVEGAIEELADITAIYVSHIISVLYWYERLFIVVVNCVDALTYAYKGIGSNEKVMPKLTGPVINSKMDNICFTFWYRGTVSSLVNVTLTVNILTLHPNGSVDPPLTELIWTVTSVEGTAWKYGRSPVSLKSTKIQKKICLRVNKELRKTNLDPIALYESISKIPNCTLRYSNSFYAPKTQIHVI